MNEGAIFGLPVARLGFGGLLGMAVGFATRKLGKFVLLGVGLLFLAVQLLAWQGWIHVDWLSLEAAAKGAWTSVDGETLAQRAWHVASADLPFGGAFAGGFAIGLRLG